MKYSTYVVYVHSYMNMHRNIFNMPLHIQTAAFSQHKRCINDSTTAKTTTTSALSDLYSNYLKMQLHIPSYARRMRASTD